MIASMLTAIGIAIGVWLKLCFLVVVELGVPLLWEIRLHLKMKKVLKNGLETIESLGEFTGKIKE